MTTLLDDFPIVPLVGSERWSSGYELGDSLDKAFPGQDADDFAYAMSYNDFGGLPEGSAIEGLLCVESGESDESSWVWLAKISGRHYWVTGWCDYTGWDCQSGVDVEGYEDPS